jgi:peptide/nickel transport system ATP-binding protein
LIVADEPVSALDVSVQAQVLNLMADLQSDLGLAYVFVAHDLRVVRHICHRVVVMYVGRVAEIGNPDDLFRAPKHPYTEALISSLPAVEPSKRKLGTISLSGEVPNPADPPSGCFFHPRCPYAVEKCRVEAPEVREIEPGRFTSCHRIEELELVGSGD